jgi:hypothetical protein
MENMVGDGRWRTHRQGDEVEGLAFQVGKSAVGDELDPVGGLHEDTLVLRASMTNSSPSES